MIVDNYQTIKAIPIDKNGFDLLTNEQMVENYQ
jgi:hypothetical protein